MRSWFVKLALRRLMSQWQSLLNVVVGVLLVAIIGASIPLYTAAITQVSMSQYIAMQPLDDVHIIAQTSIVAADVEALEATWEALNAGASAALAERVEAGPANWVSQTVIFGETSPLEVAGDARLRIAYYEGVQEALHLVEGTWPASQPADSIDLEAAISTRAAAEMGISVGDVMVLEQRGWESSRPVRVRISGTVRPANPDTPYWISPSPLRMGRSREGQPETNLLTGKAQFLNVAIHHIPDTRTKFGWRILFDHTTLPFEWTDKAIARLNEFESVLAEYMSERVEIDSFRMLYSTELPHILSAFTGEMALLGAPFGLVLLQIGALVLFFLVVMAALVRRSERREIAMLQSRGALDRQIVLLRSVEALVICALMTAAAPFLAQRILLWLIPPLTGVKHLPLSLGPAPFLYAGGVSSVAFALLLFTLRPILRLPLVQAGGRAARSEKEVWWQRYYVDVMLLVVGVAALWRMLNTGSALVAAANDTLQADPLLLLAPALLFVALGSVLLRLFPAVMHLASRLSVARKGLTGALATWQLSREPTHYARITFLLTLAVGIGWFATSFQTTTIFSQRDRARYAAGADIRLKPRDTLLDAERAGPTSLYTTLPQVEAAAQALRFFVSNVSADSRSPVRGEVLALSPETFGAVAYWRDDMGPLALPPAQNHTAPGRTLPAQAAHVGIWARFDAIEEIDGEEHIHLLDPSRGRPELWARLYDETGAFILLPLEEAPSPDAAKARAWTYMEGTLPTQGQTLRLDSIYWSVRLSGWYMRNLRLSITGLDFGTPASDWLAEPDAAWELVTDPLAPPERVEARFAAAPGLGDAMGWQVIWDEGETVSIMGLFLDYPAAGPVPALASDTFLTLNGLLPGAQYQMGTLQGGMAPWFEIAASVRYYPTLYPDERPFLVADLDTLRYTLNRRPGAAIYPTEAWLRLAPAADPQAALSTLRESDRFEIDEALTLEETLESFQTNLLSVGLIGLLYLAFIIALVLSMVSLLTYFALTVQTRRSEFSVLRAFGFSLARMTVSIALEQVMVMLVALLLGVALGLFLSYQVLPALALSTNGQAITPPLIVQVEAGALLRYGLVLLGVLAVSLGASLWLVRRLSPAHVLRLGEE